MFKKFITYALAIVFSVFLAEPVSYAQFTEVMVAEDFDSFIAFTAELLEENQEDIGIMSTEDVPFSLNRLIVRTDKNVDYHGAQYAIVGFDDTVVLQYRTAEETRSAYNAYMNDPNVIFVEEDKPIKILNNQIAVQNDTMLSWGFGSEYIDVADFRADYLNNSDLPQLSVAVIDTGIDYTHEQFTGRISGGVNLIDTNSAPEDDNGHGTNVSGVVCDGTYENVSVMPIKAMNANGSGSTLTIANGIKYAVNEGADIINMSIGGIGSFSEQSSMVRNIQEAIDSGILVVTASGNFKMNVSTCTPANIPQTIAVSATNKQNKLAVNFSNYGDGVDISAPGVSVLCADLDGGTALSSGTSVACPHVSAVIANILSYDNTLSPYEVEMLLKYNAKETEEIKNAPYGVGTASLKDFSFEAVSVDKTQLDLFEGESALLSTDSYPKTTVSFKSLDTNIASVDEFGNIRALGEGTTDIVAFTDNAKKTCKVTVSKAGDWYDGLRTELNINTPQELIEFSGLVNNGADDFAGKTVKINKDIDMQDIGFTAIGNEENKFMGTFDGQEFTIKNLTNDTFATFQGLFGVVGDKGTVKNIKLENLIALSEASLGGIAGSNYGTIQNCIVTGEVKSKNSITVLSGGICAVNFGNVISCKNSAEITVDASIVSAAGGICAKNYGTVSNSVNDGKIYGKEYLTANDTPLSDSMLLIGGIVGDNADGDIVNSLNIGVIENKAHTQTNGVSGAICAKHQAGSIENCYFTESGTYGIGEQSIGAAVSNVSGFLDNTLLSSVTAGNYSGNDLITALNVFAVDNGLYPWRTENDSFKLSPRVFYIEDNAVISADSKNMGGKILIAQYAGNELLKVKISEASSIKSSIELTDRATNIKVFWWNLSTMFPRIENLHYELSM